MTLDIFQQAFSFAILADLINDEQGTRKELEESFQEKLTTYLRNEDYDGWRVVWGPTVWKLKPDEITYPANSWYILYHPNANFEDGSVHPTYVIAIAGTPMNSDEVREKQSDAVDSVVDFNAWVDGGIGNEPVPLSSESVSPDVAYFARGAAWGTYNLVNTQSLYGISPGKTIVEFLRTLDQSPSTRIIITGHSLGGFLTTALALTLVSAGVLKSSNTLTYPIACASAGNIPWAQQFGEQFPLIKPAGTRSYQGWNHNLVNNLDVIPQLWCQHRRVSAPQWIGRIPAIYGRPVLDVAKEIAASYFVLSFSSGVVYKPVVSEYFNAPSSTVPTTPEEFRAEIMKHHLYSYLDEVGITPEQVGMRPWGQLVSARAFSRYPFMRELQRVIESPEDHQKVYDSIKDMVEVRSFLAQLV